jgi:hypothetical protein
MESNPESIKEILDELFSLLETLETQSLALTQFLKDQGIATDKKLAPYLDRAGNASSVKWRAARARMQYLLSPVKKETNDKEKDKNKEPEKLPAEKPPTDQKQSESSDAPKDTSRDTNQTAGKNPKPGAPKPGADDNAKKSDTNQKSKKE